jgi:hypothetical protein
MRFPALVPLATRAAAVLRRFPWTLALAVVAAAAAIQALTTPKDEVWLRVVLVAALGLPVTIALTLLAEARRWPAGRRTAVLFGSVVALVGYYFAWRGFQTTAGAIHYLQLSAAMHLGVAFLPFIGGAESGAFWQYNRRMFLGFLRAVVFSGVLFVGAAVALGAVDKLFGVDVPPLTYARIWLFLAFVVNTWIFLAAVPTDLGDLARDAEYPRALKMFAQYVLTPLAFTYLIILLAYLVKIVVDAEWPSGWIGWLVASVSMTGLLGFLLVHPLRQDPAEGWIRTYTRWLFIGLIPAALMLLAAFWKRVVPYGLTEPRVLGILLGLWLLGIALLYTIRRGAGIRAIPVSLAALLLLTAYGPLSLTHISIESQGRRLAAMLKGRGGAGPNHLEASAALRFLMEREAGDEIAARIGHKLPPILWDSLGRFGERRDTLGTSILALAGATYVPEHNRFEAASSGADGFFYLAREERTPLRVASFDWMLLLSTHDTVAQVPDMDTVRVLASKNTAVVRIRAGADTLQFDLRPLGQRDSAARASRDRNQLELQRRWIDAAPGRRRGALWVSDLNGRRSGDSVWVDYWRGWVLLGGDSTGRPAAVR